jgi:hypothetical protein
LVVEAGAAAAVELGGCPQGRRGKQRRLGGGILSRNFFLNLLFSLGSFVSRSIARLMATESGLLLEHIPESLLALPMLALSDA